LRLSVCQSVCPSASTLTVAFFYRFFLTKIGTDVRIPKRKNEFVRGQYRTTAFYILSPKIHVLGQEVLKAHANIMANSRHFRIIKEIGAKEHDGEVRF